MNKIFRSFIIIVVFPLITSCPALASHLAGQDFTYVFVDSAAGIYHYRVSLSLYQDCLNGQPAAIADDNPAYLAVYDGSGVLIRSDSVSYSGADSMTITATGSCATGGRVPLCVNRKTFTMDYYLPASPTGYQITYQRCCLNPTPVNIDSPDNTGISCFCSIPPSGTTTHNNSAVFTYYPPFIIALNTPLSFDFSATDADGDSLSYALCVAWLCAIGPTTIKPNPPAPPPFASINYSAGFTYNNPMSCSVPLSIDPSTGMLTGTPDVAGQYLITVCCSEWRHEILVNTIQREFEFTVVNCKLNTPELSAGAPEVLYPNPATMLLTISAAGIINQVTITNLLGQTVYSRKYDTEKALVDVADLPMGVYYIKINGTEVRKFVKQ